MESISLAPLQDFTDRAYRCSFAKNITGIDTFYTPYLSVDRCRKPDAVPTDWVGESVAGNVIPQILPANIDELKVLCNKVEIAGFKTVNLNLGCPYPMVMNRGRGAGLIAKPDLVGDFIDYILENTPFTVGVKTRVGITTDDGAMPLFEVLAEKNITEVILHARTSRLMYRGVASVESFVKYKNAFPNIDLVYNGDIFSYADYVNLKQIVPEQTRWMLGRGVLGNLFLPWQIKNETSNLPADSLKLLRDFLSDWLDLVETDSFDEHRASERVKNSLTYLNSYFSDPIKAKRIGRKSHSFGELKTSLLDLVQ